MLDEGMNVRIRRVGDDEIDEVVRLSLLAWAPVFVSFEQVLGAAIFGRVYLDWRSGQEAVVREMCGQSENRVTWVAELDRVLAGFVVVELNVETGVGEIQLLAVHPDHQNRGIGTELNAFALRQMKDAGMRLAVVGTGGDPGHAPARRSYERAGFTALPLVRYYKDL